MQFAEATGDVCGVKICLYLSFTPTEQEQSAETLRDEIIKVKSTTH